MSRAIADDGPAHFSLPIVRGDDVARVFEFYTSFTDETTNTPLNLTGRAYTSAIAASKGGSVVATPTCTTPTPTNGQVVWSLTDTQTDTLTAGTYVFDIVENAGTTTERTVVLGVIKVTGRATA